MKKVLFFIVMIAFCNLNDATAQWNTSGNDIYNTNTGNVGIGTNTPSTLLYAAKNMIEPTITIRNLGGSGGATYTMIDDASGANWKFKATLSGGFKIRDHANLMDVIVIEPNSMADAIYIGSGGNIGIGTGNPQAKLHVDGGDARIHGLTCGMGAGSISSNSSLGYQALYSNTTGFANTAIGRNALRNNSTGFRNTALGSSALIANTTGGDNTASGNQALFSNTTGGDNTAYGSGALLNNTTGAYNTACGSAALASDTSGYSNTANGCSALRTNTNGSDNTASGYFALYSSETGHFNTASGSFALSNNTTGSNNTAIGGWALSSNVTGNSNTCIGDHADINSSNLSNATAIGGYANVDASNKVRIGNSSVTVIEGQVAWSNPSDGRFKRNIIHDVPGLAFIMRLDPVQYQFDNSSYSSYIGEKRADNEIAEENISDPQMGFVAQDVEQVCKALNVPMANLINLPSTEKSTYSIAYATLVVPLVKAVQEQQEIIQELKSQIENQKKQIDGLIQKMSELEGKFIAF